MFLICLPFVGVFVYLIVRGKGMGAREIQRSLDAEQEMRTYIQEAAGSTGGGSADHVDALARLAELRKSGDLTEEEYQNAKRKVLA